MHVAVVKFHRQLIFFPICFIYVLVTISKHENKRELKSNQGNKVKTSLHLPFNNREGNWSRKASRNCFWGRTGDQPRPQGAFPWLLRWSAPSPPHQTQ